MQRFLQVCARVLLGVACLAGFCYAQDFQVPAAVSAGDEADISTTGSGKATFYLIGPGVSRKSEVNLGESIHLQTQDTRTAGDYLAIRMLVHMPKCWLLRKCRQACDLNFSGSPVPRSGRAE